MSLKAQATSGIRWSTLSSVISTVADLGRTIVLAWYLSAIDFGLMAMVSVIIGLAQRYSDLGIGAAIIHRQDATDDQLSSLYWLNVISGFAACILVWVSTPLVVWFFHEPRLRALLAVVAIFFVVLAIGQQFELLLQKELAFKTLTIVEGATSAANLIVAVTLAVMGFGVWALVYSFLLSGCVKTILLLVYGMQLHRPRLHFRRADLKGYISFGLYQMGERTLSYISQRLDQILIGSLVGTAALGYYNFAFNLTVRPVSRINPIATRVAFPVFSRLQTETETLKRGYLKVVGLLATVNAPILLGLAAVAPTAIPLIFGWKWLPSVVLVQILCFVSFSRSIWNPIGSLQLAKGRADLGFYFNILLLACSLPSVYFGARFGHAVGVALGLLIVQIVISLPAYFIFARPLIGPCGLSYAEVVLKPLGIACAMGAIAVSLPWVAHLGIQWISLVLQIAIGGSVYLLFLRLLNPEAIVEFQSALLLHRGVASGHHIYRRPRTQ